VIVDGHCQLLFRDFLADYIEIEKFLDFYGFGQLVADRRRNHIIGNNLIADIDALVADVNRGPCDQFFNIILALGAE
jgi:hypothetical protein